MKNDRPMFTARHYQAITDVLHDVRKRGLSHLSVAVALADTFAADNPNFDRKKFWSAIRDDAET